MAVLLLPVVLLNERTDSAGGVDAARGVAKERMDSDGGVVAARGVAKERTGLRWRCCRCPWCC